MANESRPYDAAEHDLVQRAASDALTLASMPGNYMARKLVKVGNATISVQVFITDDRSAHLLDNSGTLKTPRPVVGMCDDF